MKVVKPLVCVTWHYVTALPYCVSIRTSYLIMTKRLPSVEGPCWLPPHLHRVFIPVCSSEAGPAAYTASITVV